MSYKITVKQIPGESTEFELAPGSNLTDAMEAANMAFSAGEVRVNGAKVPNDTPLKSGDKVTQAKPARGA